MPADVWGELVASIFRAQDYANQHVSPKGQFPFNGLDGLTLQKIELFMNTAVRTLHPTKPISFTGEKWNRFFSTTNLTIETYLISET
jgi:hypothetical protein